jgi:hypothetical protein
MMLIVADSEARAEVEVLLRKAGAHGFTELGPAAGWGESGPRLGSGAYPETSTVLFTVLDQADERQVRVALSGFEAAGRRIRVYAWDVEEVA